MTDITEDIAALRDDPVDILALYGGKDGARDWIISGCWVRPGEAIAHVSADLPERIARLLDALEAAQKDAEAFRSIVENHVSVSFTPTTVKVGQTHRANLNTLKKQAGIASFVRQKLAAMKAQP